jgi:hypothetical protein
MKLQILFILVILSAGVYSQDLEVFIETDKAEYKRYSYYSGSDSIKITYKIKNTGTNTVVFRLADSFDLNYTGEETGYYGHCFTVNAATSYRQIGYGRTKESFVEINPGGEISYTGYYYIGWLCRSAPPRGNLTFEISYERTVLPEDNYYMFKSYYSGEYEKIFTEAWTGTVKSNKVTISIVD